MSVFASFDEQTPDRFGGGFARAIGLHVLVGAVLAALAIYVPSHTEHWGENASAVGSIQASMVSALPLPSKVMPVEKAVLATENPTPAPKPPPKEATQPPPKPTDILIKEKTPKTPPKAAPVDQPTPPKHPQPTPPTPKAATGDAAALPEALTQLKNGTAMATVQDRSFGNRYAYYSQIISRIVAQNWQTQEVDPGSSQGKRATILFDINRDGVPQNIRIETKSGSSSLDASALHALQRVDNFGPLPAGDHITVEFSFDYKQP